MSERMCVLLQEEGILILPADLRTRLGLNAGDLLDISEQNGGILLTPRHATVPTAPDPAANDPQFQSKLKSMQEMLENL